MEPCSDPLRGHCNNEPHCRSAQKIPRLALSHRDAEPLLQPLTLLAEFLTNATVAFRVAHASAARGLPCVTARDWRCYRRRGRLFGATSTDNDTRIHLKQQP